MEPNRIKLMQELREEISRSQYSFDFLSTCETVNTLLERANQTPLSYQILKQWGIIGGESMSEITQILDDWMAHVDARGKDNV
jgi:protein gp37